MEITNSYKYSAGDEDYITVETYGEFTHRINDILNPLMT